MEECSLDLIILLGTARPFDFLVGGWGGGAVFSNSIDETTFSKTK